MTTHRVRRFFKGFLINLVLPVAIVGGSIVAVRPLLEKAPPAAEMPAPQDATRIRVRTVKKQSLPARIHTTGSAEPTQELKVIPEVSGKLSWISDALTVGGHFKKGATIAKINDKDYQLTLRQQRNQVAKAELEVKLEAERGNIAKHEWDLLKDRGAISASGNRSLATRENHLDVAKIALDAAQSAVEQAELNLSRTVIRAPFDAVVLSENAELGQVVGANSTLATLIGSNELWIRAALPMDQLALLTLRGDKESRSRARVRLRGSRGEGRSWDAYADRLVHELDASTKSAQVLFVVQNPFDTNDGQLPLLPGTFVELDIEGSTQEDVYKVPRSAISEGHYVWKVGPNSKLHKVAISIRWGDNDDVYVRSAELQNGDHIAEEPPRRSIEGAPVQIEEVDQPDRADEGSNENEPNKNPTLPSTSTASAIGVVGLKGTHQ